MTVRTDLPYLRRRSRPRTTAAPQPAVAPAAPAATSTTGSPAVADFLAGRSTRPGRERSTPPAASVPTASPAAPAPAPSPAAPAATPGSSLLDLGSSEPAPTSVSHPTGGSLLDLSAPGPAAPSVDASSRHRAEPQHALGLPTVSAGERRILTADLPVVHLTRMQSAAGALELRLAIPNPTHVALAVVIETRDGRESIVLPGLAQQGPDPRAPIVRSTSLGAAVDLRKVTQVARLLVVALPQSPDQRMPGGTAIIGTYGGTRLELPLVDGPTFGAQALFTAYAVEGRLVVRAEHDPFSGTLHQVCDAYGFSELTWRDPFTPLV